VLFGIGKHQSMAKVTLLEGIANLILSIALVPTLGIVGDALGTAVPLCCTFFLFMPRHMKKQIGVPVGTFVRQAYSLPFLLNLPLAAALWILNRYFTPRNLIQLVVEIVGAFLFYGVGAFWAYKTGRVFQVKETWAPAPALLIPIVPDPEIGGEYQEES
jgi:O-antigen/teichoic acid export membrane protein